MRSNSLDMMMFGSSSARTLAGMPAQTQRLHTTNGWHMVVSEERTSPAAIIDVDAIGIRQSQIKQNGFPTTSERDMFGGFCQDSLGRNTVSSPPKRCRAS